MRILHELLSGLTEFEVTGGPDVMITDVSCDSRTVASQNVFVAIAGATFDGHQSVAEAIGKGATVVVGQWSVEQIDFGTGRLGHDVAYVRVPDSRLAYAHMLLNVMPGIGEAMRAISFIGVTGTNGKTTIATVLGQLYKDAGRQIGVIGTTGISYYDHTTTLLTVEATHTTPDIRSLFELIITMHAADVNTVVMEVSSHALEQHRVYGIPFHGTLFTNLTHDHLDYHGTMEHYALAKKKLMDSLASTSYAVVNGDDEWVLFITRDCKGRVIRVGRGSLNDVCIEDEQLGTDGCEYDLTAPSLIHPHALDELNDTDKAHIKIPMIGAFNVMNTALCSVAAIADGIRPSAVRKTMATVHGPVGRMERTVLPNGAMAVIDYAHTPDALENALRTLREIKDPSAKLHVVFGCGGNRDVSKRADMGTIAADIADVVWVTSDNPRTENPMSIIEQVLVGCKATTNQNVHVHEDRREAIERAASNSESGDVILIAGKGHEQYQIIGTEKRPYSDSEVVQRLAALE